MSGFFGCVSRHECVSDVFYGTDYHSHLGTKRAGMAFYNGKKFIRSIHSLENGYFRNKFEDELPKFGESQMGIGVISDNESQPITITSHLGRYAVVTVARIVSNTYLRIFGKPFTKVNRRMGVVVSYAPNGSNLDALRDKCKAAASKVEVY